MSHEIWLQKAEIYAAGALDGEELAEFELHLKKGCPPCEEVLVETGETLLRLIQTSSLQKPSATVKSAVLESIAPPRRSQVKSASRAVWMTPASVAGLMVLVVVLFSNVMQTRHQVEQYREMLTAPGMHVVDFAGMTPSPFATGRLIWNQDQEQGLFVANRLSPLPKGKTYELWAGSESGMVPAGTFKVDRDGCCIMQVSQLPKKSKIDRFAVTEEPEGGVSRPSGPLHLQSKVI